MKLVSGEIEDLGFHSFLHKIHLNIQSFVECTIVEARMQLLCGFISLQDVLNKTSKLEPENGK